jgi:hypothetical protein
VLLTRIGVVTSAGFTPTFGTVWLVGFVVLVTYVTAANVVGALRARRRRQEGFEHTRMREGLSRPRLLGQTSGSAMLPDLGRFSGPGGTCTLSADEIGVHINLRAAWNQRLVLASLRTRWRGFEGDELWYSDWDGIKIARRDREGDAIFMVNDAGERVWFSGNYPREMASFTQELLHRGVPVEFVRTTYWDPHRSRRHWRVTT